MRVLALLDGTLANPDAPLIRVDDLGLMRGDGIFETVLVVDGKPRELGPHFDRLVRSAAMLDLPTPDRAGFDRATRAILDAWTGGNEMALKWVYTRGVEGGDGTPTGFALGLEIAEKVKKQRAEGIAAITLERGIDNGLAARAPWLLLGAKTLSYAVNMAALREAERRGAAEVIFTTSDNHVLEGPTSTLVAAGHARVVATGEMKVCGLDHRVNGSRPPVLHSGLPGAGERRSERDDRLPQAVPHAGHLLHRMFGRPVRRPDE
ncbi:aminotransferase class IV, partial [Kibdelosporangium lantanae]